MKSQKIRFPLLTLTPTLSLKGRGGFCSLPLWGRVREREFFLPLEGEVRWGCNSDFLRVHQGRNKILEGYHNPKILSDSVQSVQDHYSQESLGVEDMER